MKACSLLPAGGSVYRFIQKKFGRLKADPMSRIPAQAQMAHWILEMEGKIEGKVFFEVGTGHNPIVPIGFFLCGAKKIVTVDRYRRLDLDILKKSLAWLAENRKEIFEHYESVVEWSVFNERMDLLKKLAQKPKECMLEANIEYLAPADASNIGLPDESIDYHISTTVFEHIPRQDIKQILNEARRILKEDGAAIHFIDLSDHFQHQDNSITSINFLKYSENEWIRIAGNEFAYCNRLRVSDYSILFKEEGFDIFRKEVVVDRDARKVIQNGFILDGRFRNYNVDDLCATGLRIALKKIK